MSFNWDSDLPANDNDPVNKEEVNEIIEHSDWLNNNMACQADHSDRSDNSDLTDNGDLSDESNLSEDSIDGHNSGDNTDDGNRSDCGAHEGAYDADLTDDAYDDDLSKLQDLTDDAYDDDLSKLQDLADNSFDSVDSEESFYSGLA